MEIYNGMMISRYKKPELLAPAGSFSGMRAAVNAGADAVYMGGKKFGARAYADNPDEEGIIKAIEFCHVRNRKLYLTVNTLLKSIELEKELYDYLLPVYEAGLDAVIVQDIGVMEFIGRLFPGLDIHISTQAAITSYKGIEGIMSLLSNPDSVTRVVPARELNLSELKEMRRNTGIELEVFIHGALCYCYSGQCLFSSFVGGRSGNRGRCAQPCRKLYEANGSGIKKRGYFLSTKDMCTLDVLGDLIDSGIDSFKIEGRMKSEEYAAGVVSVYRELIDSYADGKNDTYEIKKNGLARIKEIYNRGGFNGGYLRCYNGPDMMSTKRPGHYGVYIGRVEKTEGRKAFVRVEEPVFKGDILEIREDQSEKTVYEFTAGEEHSKGTVFSVLTMKERKADKGYKVFRTRKEVLLREISERYIEKDLKIGVDISLKAMIGEPLVMTMRPDGAGNYIDGSGKEADMLKTKCCGRMVQKAITSETTEEELRELVSRLGNTEFTVSHVSIMSDKGVFVPVQEIKKCRRECADKLFRMLSDAGKRKKTGSDESDLKYKAENISDIKDGLLQKEEMTGNFTDGEMSVCVSVTDQEQLDTILVNDTSRCITGIYMDISAFLGNDDRFEKIYEKVDKSGRKLTVKLPVILRIKDYERVKEICLKIKDKVRFLAPNYESIRLMMEIGGEYRSDHNIYCFNNRFKNLLNTGYTLPEELNAAELEEISDKKGELIVYGLLPVMTSAQCVYKTITGKCEVHEDISLRDEKGYTFRTHSDCAFCYNRIYNSAVKCLFEKGETIRKLGCGSIRAELTFENALETGMVLKALEMLKNGQPAPHFPTEIMGLKLTNGHFNRGVL